jgi:hypothetical protein
MLALSFVWIVNSQVFCSLNSSDCELPSDLGQGYSFQGVETNTVLPSQPPVQGQKSQIAQWNTQLPVTLVISV